ncbi:hypothetical protein KIH74_17360 [Kineosporia sp. J2-2]|uniref:Uncharacterized protein n=1 Tax=Kineosporia corallincola TaxID=2835133 RepID=A0ABS5THZ0_9ACTN|nr:hypothetical protein [Kineosporia corallincola]MBT0770716.1 hypothetical protein [Kineosporia corallincola]
MDDAGTRPLTVRHRRLRAGDGDDWHDDWFGRWDEAEHHYFGQVVPRGGFDLLLTT